MLTEAERGPVPVVITAANPHDLMLLQDALEAMIVEPPNPHAEREQHLRLDEAYDGVRSDTAAKVCGYERTSAGSGRRRSPPAGQEETAGAAVGRRADDQLARPLPSHPARVGRDPVARPQGSSPPSSRSGW